MGKLMYRCKECSFVGEVSNEDMYIHCKNCGSIHVNTFYKNNESHMKEELKEIKNILLEIREILNSLYILYSNTRRY